MSLHALIDALRAGPGVALKREIARVADVLPERAECGWLASETCAIRNGDDAAAIADGDGYLLLAAEGMLPQFVATDPWFAGFCAVMVNVSDILAMGGRPYAVVDVLFAGDAEQSRKVLEGMCEAARRFGVPVVGGHTSRLSSPDTLVAAAIVGRARRLVTSFDAQAGDELVLALDLRGRYRGESYFDAATGADAARLRATLAVLPQLADAGLLRAGKDVSMAGIAGTLVMLCEGSGVGATLAIDALPRPPDTPLAQWLATFPSFGFLLAVDPAHVSAVHARFADVGVASTSAGRFQPGGTVEFTLAGARAPFWDLREESLTGFGASAAKLRASRQP